MEVKFAPQATGPVQMCHEVRPHQVSVDALTMLGL